MKSHWQSVEQDKLKKEKDDLSSMRRNCRATKRQNQDLIERVATQEKQIEAQTFVMNNLRNGIEYLKEHCTKADRGGEFTSVSCTLIQIST